MTIDFCGIDRWKVIFDCKCKILVEKYIIPTSHLNNTVYYMMTMVVMERDLSYSKNALFCIFLRSAIISFVK